MESNRNDFLQFEVVRIFWSVIFIVILWSICCMVMMLILVSIGIFTSASIITDPIAYRCLLDPHVVSVSCRFYVLWNSNRTY